MIKQCGYCCRVYGDDGEYHDIGLKEPVVEFYVAPPKKERVLVSHTICAECFDVMMKSAQKGAGSKDAVVENHVAENKIRPAGPIVTNGSSLHE